MMKKKKQTFIFLKSTGGLIGEVTPDMDMNLMDLTNFLVKTVEIADDGSEFWQGDYYSGSVVQRNNRPVIMESTLMYNTNVKILTEYPIHKQLNVLIDVIRSSSLPKTPEFEEMCEYLDRVKEEHKKKIEVYKSNPDAYIWYSYEQETEDMKKKTI